MEIRRLVMLGVCATLIGCGGGGTAKPPSDADLKAMNDKMADQMKGMTLPKVPGKPDAPKKQ